MVPTRNSHTTYLVENNFEDSGVGVETRGIQNRVFGIVYFCDLFL